MGTVTVRRVFAQVLTTDYRTTTIRRVIGQTIEIENKPVNIRTVRGYYLQLANDPVNLRTIRGHYLVVDEVIPNVLTDFKANLLAKINAQNNTTFKVADVTFGIPSVVTGERRNSKITVNAQVSSGHSKSQVVYYDRIKLDHLIKDTTAITLDMTGITSVHALLPQINAFYKLALVPADVLQKTIRPGESSFILTIAPTSLYFKPATQVQFGSGVQLSSEFDIADLDGFSLPTLAEGFLVKDLPGF